MTTITPRVEVKPQAQEPVGTPPVEGIKAPVETAAPDTQQISPEFAKLAQRQKMLFKKEQELKAMEERLKSKESEYTQNYIPKAQLKQNPLTYLTEQGITAETLLQELNQQGDPMAQEIKRLNARLDELTGNQTKAKEEQESQTKRQYEQALNQIRFDVDELIASDSSFEAIKANNASEAVVELIRETYEKTEKLLTVQQAAEQVESYIIDQGMKLASLEKVKKRLQPPETPPVDSAGKPQGKAPVIVPKQPAQHQVRTLTNSVITAPGKTLTEKQRRERAIAAFQNRLEG